MAHPQPKQADLFQVAELPGRPLLHWHGKRPLNGIPYYPAQLRERYGFGVCLIKCLAKPTSACAR